MIVKGNDMSRIELLHGSDHVIERPDLRLGKMNNDYGQGFYCTQDPELAKEWACKDIEGGFANAYDFDGKEISLILYFKGNRTAPRRKLNRVVYKIYPDLL